MKASQTTFAFFTALMTWALVLSACGQKKDDGDAVDGRARGVTTSAAAPTNLGVQVTSVGNNGGTSIEISQYETGVKGLLAAAWNPDSVGDITDLSVVFATNIYFSTNGQVNATNTKLRIWVTDSYALENYDLGNGVKAVPFVISFDSSNSTITGTQSGTQFTVTFKDSYQQVTITATKSGTDRYLGRISYANLKDQNGSALRSANPMGYFETLTSALLN